MRRPVPFMAPWVLALAFGMGATATATAARAADEAPDPDAAGVAVVAEGDAADVTWPLAQAAYAKPTLRAKGLSEAEARVLAGEVPAEDAMTQVKDLAELRRAIRGEDTVTREILGTIGRRTHTKALVIVSVAKDAPPQVRLFDVSKKTFDAARWQPEPKDGGWSWDSTVTSLERTLMPVPVLPPAAKKSPALTVVPANTPPAKDKSSKMFWESPWFWVALGSAALIGGAVFLGTRDWSTDNVHVRMQVPQ